MNEQEILSSWDESIGLLDCYEPLLSSSQQETLRLYFRFNLSLSEIAEEKDISRAAAFDALKKGVAKLHYYEEKLGLNRKNKVVHDYLEMLNNTADIQEIKKEAAHLKEAFDDGI